MNHPISDNSKKKKIGHPLRKNSISRRKSFNRQIQIAKIQNRIAHIAKSGVVVSALSIRLTWGNTLKRKVVVSALSIQPSVNVQLSHRASTKRHPNVSAECQLSTVNQESTVNRVLTVNCHTDCQPTVNRVSTVNQVSTVN